jgi:choline transport protein
MDDKILGSVGDLELTDQARDASPISDVGGDVSNMTRDEKDMAFYGKKEQLKVRVLNGPAVAMSRD